MSPVPPRVPWPYRIDALICAMLYFPCGLVWAYGLALFALPLVPLGFWLLDRAARIDESNDVVPDRAQQQLHATAQTLLIMGLVASLVSLVVTK